MIGKLSFSLSSVAFNGSPIWAEQRSSTWFTVLTCGFTLFTVRDLFYETNTHQAVPVLPFALVEKAHIHERDVQAWVSILLAVHGAGIAVGSPICACWADRSATRRWPYLASLLGLVGATLILSFSESVSLFVVGRLLQGLSGAVAWTVPLAIITDRVGVTQVGPYLGYMTLGRSAGMSAGPIFGGLVFLYWGYFRTYVTAFIILSIDFALRLLLVQGPQLTPSKKAGGSFVALLGPSVLSPLVRKTIQQHGVRKSATARYVGTGVALGCLSFVGHDGALYQTFLVMLLVVAGTFNLFSEISSWIDAVAMAESQAMDYPDRFPAGGAIAQVYGLTNVMFALGFVAGPLGAGFVYQKFGWAATVLLLALVTVISSVPTMLWLGRTRTEGTNATAPVGAVVTVKDETQVV
ncbi:putative MFS multidrug transporter [Aspergillus fumigatus Af293]|uniref:MFS multidrug transporter, putative n=1 Tax=Aspergillus fumigatus (strain ATCC MYA-4609 / CBS 101355 / FGSC A1100 / Af293) TaxID=330879 RepID=Q4WH60_ASPFU|nr:MFS multidrug transporter, putative [Aspergillus fumigatus Af293]EAL86731.1 MFS multidrug transporter, putative [Aspergillus fumigatus Af293]